MMDGKSLKDMAEEAQKRKTFSVEEPAEISQKAWDSLSPADRHSKDEQAEMEEKAKQNLKADMSMGKVMWVPSGPSFDEALIKRMKSTAVQAVHPPLKDSGQRRQFDTGSVRDIRTGKGRFDLISPIALRRLAVHLENGMTKYGERNWEKGQPLMSYMDSALRHLNVYIEGDRSEDHMAAALWNIHCFIHTEEMINRQLLPGALDDRPATMISER